MRVGWLAAAISVISLACALSPSAPVQPPAVDVVVDETPTPFQAEPTAVPSPTATPTNMPSPTPTTLPDVQALPDPASAAWQHVTSGLIEPLDIQHAGDDRLFFVEQAGVIRVYTPQGLLDAPFLDLRDRVLRDANERGLLGLAFHPDFINNGYFYVNYTGAGGTSRIARFQVSSDPNLADPDTERVLLSYDQPYANHNGGGLAFGPDGYLYIATGDGGSAGDPQNRAQRLNTLLGKLLRIDVDAGEFYAIPSDNPFVAQQDARAEIWAYGLRNPWRFTFDRLTGDMFIADVGQNQWEEISFEPAGSGGGLNYGWKLLEGTHDYAGGGEGTVLPVAEYSHNSGCSVTGGEVVRSDSLPAWRGVYLYGDFCSGLVWGLVRGADGVWQNQLLYDTEFNITGFGLDRSGDIYLADRNGAIYRLSPAQ